jgi:hypothetical protein
MLTTAPSDLKYFNNQLITITRKYTSVALMLNGKKALLSVLMEHYVPQHDPCSITQYPDGTKPSRPNFGHLQYSMPQISTIQQNDDHATTT